MIVKKYTIKGGNSSFMIKYGITREFVENHRVLFGPYMHKALSHVMSAELSIYAKDTTSEVALA